MEELLYFVNGMVYAACVLGLIHSFLGETLAVDSHTFDVKLHSREDSYVQRIERLLRRLYVRYTTKDGYPYNE